eukprot:9845252-Ditylum_brightwellii.AAC.1
MLLVVLTCGDMMHVVKCWHFIIYFPINTQFVERGVKESGYVSLGRRNETNRSVMVTAHSGTMVSGLRKGRDDINKDMILGYRSKMKQLQ